MFKKLASTLAAAILLATGLNLFVAPTSNAVGSTDASLNISTSTVKGVAIGSSNAKTCLDGPTCAELSSNRVTINITPTQASDTSNSGSFITVFNATDAGATVKVVKYPSSTTTVNLTGFNAATAYQGTSAITDRDFFIVGVTPASGAGDARFYGFTIRAVSTDASLSSTLTLIKGQQVTSLGTPSSTFSGSITPGSVTISSTQAADTTGTSPYQTTFARNDSTAMFFKRAKFASGSTPSQTDFNNAANYSNQAITDGDFFLISLMAGDMMTSSFYKIVVTVSNSGGGSPAPSTPTQAEIAAAAAQAAAAAAQAAREAAAAKVAAAQTVLYGIVKADKPGSQSDYQSAGFNVTSKASLDRVNASVLKLSASDRSDSAKIKAIVDAIEFDESFFNKTARPSLGTFASYGVSGVNEKNLATVNAKILALPEAKRTDLQAIKAIAKEEGFISTISDPVAKQSISSNTLINMQVLDANSPYKAQVTNALRSIDTTKLTSIDAIKAAVAEQVKIAKSRRDRTAAIIAKIEARK